MAAMPRFRAAISRGITPGPPADKNAGAAPDQKDLVDEKDSVDQKHPVDEMLPPVKMFTSGLQHVAAMYAGVVAPPMIVGPAVGLSAKETAFLIPEFGIRGVGWHPRIWQRLCLCLGIVSLRSQRHRLRSHSQAGSCPTRAGTGSARSSSRSPRHLRASSATPPDINSGSKSTGWPYTARIDHDPGSEATPPGSRCQFQALGD